MIVYRYLTRDELYNLLYKMKYEIGERPSELQMASSRKYKKGVKYLHFFKKLEDLPVIQGLRKSPQGCFVGMFDIPTRDLLGGYGVGEFTGTPIDGTDKFVVVKEFAVELRHVRSNNLIDYIYDEHCDLTVEEVKEMFEELAQEPGEK